MSLSNTKQREAGTSETPSKEKEGSSWNQSLGLALLADACSGSCRFRRMIRSFEVQSEHSRRSTWKDAYILASVAVDLRVGQVVDVPNYVITAVLNKDVFVDDDE